MRSPVPYRTPPALVTAFALAVALASLAVAQTPLPVERTVLDSRSAVTTHALRGAVVPVDGAHATLRRSAAGMALELAARELVPGHAYTAWWIVIDRPSVCAAAPCTVPEVMGTPSEVGANVLLADALVAPEDGSGVFEAWLEPGPIDHGWFTSAFTDPMGAEVHVALHDHGPVIAELHEEMLSTFRAGCRDDSLPPSPPRAMADGTPGPNACQMWQLAMFLPEAGAALRMPRAVTP